MRLLRSGSIGGSRTRRRWQAAGARDKGATATEYAILAGFVAVVITAGLFAYGQTLLAWFTSMAAQLPW